MEVHIHEKGMRRPLRTDHEKGHGLTINSEIVSPKDPEKSWTLTYKCEEKVPLRRTVEGFIEFHVNMKIRGLSEGP